jgi:hypothetical protein
LAVLTPERTIGDAWPHLPDSSKGVVSMLSELQAQFDMIDSKSDFSAYKLLVLPDEVIVDDALADKLQAFVSAGGKIIASYKSGLRPDGQGFAGDFWPMRYKGDAPFSPDFLLPAPALAKGIPAVQHVMYLQGVEVEAVDGAEVLADAYAPYFNRTWRHFCSHRHTPSANRKAYPGVIRRGGVIYFMHPIFRQYQKNAPRWVKQMLSAAIDLLLDKPLVHVDGPSTLLASLMEQPQHGRRVLHLLHYVPQRKCDDFDVLEDVIPLHDLRCSVAADKPVKSVTAVPQGQKIEFAQKNGRVVFVLPKLEGHQMVEIQL